MPLAVVLALCALLLGPAAARAADPAAPAATAPRAVLAFLPDEGDDNPDPVEERLAERPELSLGLLSATQGTYSPGQAVLDMSAGVRTSPATYDPRSPPDLELVVGGDRTGFISRWSFALRRADTALDRIRPGLLAGSIPGGAGYAGVAGRGHLEAVVAADQAGDVGAVSIGPSADLAARAGRLLRSHRLVVVGLPTGEKGDRGLDALLAARRAQDVVLVIETPPRARLPQLLAVGAAGLGAPGALTSTTTRLDGVVAGTDVPATVLRRLGLQIPGAVRGEPMRSSGGRDPDGLRSLESRLKVVSGRRVPALQALLFSWVALMLVLGLAADRRGVLAARRIGALSVLWVLPVLLLTGALAPGRAAEIMLVVGLTIALAAATDRFVRWPRAPMVPAGVALVTYAVDLAMGSPLIIRSLLGVNPRAGSRFYGLGNELESSLSVLLLVGLAALLTHSARSRRSAAIFAGAGLLLGVFVGAGRLGADVGGVITLGAGVAAATLLMLPGRPRRGAIAAAVAAPVVALIALAGLDLATGGDAHFTRTILRAEDGAALEDVIARRYTLAWNVLTKGVMPFITLVALLAAAYGWRYRDRIYAPLRSSAAWKAGLVGSLVASVVGALFNDSGPILVVFGVFLLACVTAYVRGDPALVHESPSGGGRL